MRVICDEHDIEMVYNYPMCWYECPIDTCTIRMPDEALYPFEDYEEIRAT